MVPQYVSIEFSRELRDEKTGFGKIKSWLGCGGQMTFYSLSERMLSAGAGEDMAEAGFRGSLWGTQSSLLVRSRCAF